MHYFDLDWLMSLELPWFEPKNEHRGGWSGVSKTSLPTSDGEESFFVKRQVNFAYRDPWSFFSRAPTLRREYRGIRLLNRLGISTPEVVFYAEDKQLRSVLVTRELAGYLSLSDFLAGNPDPSLRKNVISEITRAILKLHRASVCHGGLYGKHIMLLAESENPQITFIDLEKSKRCFFARRWIYKDISQLLRRTDGFTEQEKDSILDAYDREFPAFSTKVKQKISKKLGNNYS